MKTARLLIAGASGFLGRHITRLMSPHFQLVNPLGRAMLDVCASDVEKAITHYSPDVVINCAGNKDVAWCEKHSTEAFYVNALGAGRVARACKNNGVRLLHISTDYTTGGGHFVYGKSKLLGDALVMAEHPEATVCRISGVYAPDAVWVKWLRAELARGTPVEAFKNVTNSPLYVEDLGWMLLRATRDGPGLCVMAGPTAENRYRVFMEYANAHGFNTALIRPDYKSGHMLPSDVSQVSHYACATPLAMGMADMAKAAEGVAA